MRNQDKTEHPTLAAIVSPEPCRFCHANVWWDEETETYETAAGEFLCSARNNEYYLGHETGVA